MNYHASHSWTFSALIGAYLDLALAYLLLCGSTLVFFASKFLSIFGLYLPCPCNGLFGSDPDGSGSGCLQQRLLVDSPVTKISSVQMSLKSKPPFDSLWINNDHFNVKLIENSDGNRECNGVVEFEGEEASCSSLSDARAPIRRNEMVGLGFGSGYVRGGLHGVKGKGILSERSPRFGGGVVRRRRRAAVDSSRMMLGRDYSMMNPLEVREITEDDSSVLANSGTDGNRYEKEAPAGVNLCEGTKNMSHLDELVGEGEDLDEESHSAEDLADDEERMIDGSEENAIRALEQALEEEHAARATLYVELEKERSAAATAADEAMAMILRLQKEKASIEMEARQYQRMIEEKSAYDAEEMNILKEIIVRREREKHFLEQEVEVYRRMMLPENGQLNGDFPGMDRTIRQMLHSSFDINQDPILMLQQISDSIDKKEMGKVAKESSNVDFAFEKESSLLDWGKGRDCLNLGDVSRSVSIEKRHLQPLESVDECKHESQEKGMIAQGLGSETSSVFYNSNDLQGHDLLEKTIIFIDEEQGKNDVAKLSQGISGLADQSLVDAELNFPFYGISLEKHGKNAGPRIKDGHNSVSEAEPSILDVHVIDDKSKLSDEGSGKESEALSNVAAPARLGKCGLRSEASGVRGVDILCNRPSTETEINTCRSSSDMSGAVDKSLGKSLHFELRRNSMSAVENERLKLESEVGWLRERLRIVQEGREKLSFSMEHLEREKVQLQLLEDIARQLNEIRQLTEPGKAIRQASLPPPSSKVTSKKRRYRSLSSGFHMSS